MYMNTNISIILLGGGSSTRFNAQENKINLKIDDKYILDILLESFLKISLINEIIIVGDVKHTTINNIIYYCDKGITRIDSVYKGFNCIKNKNNIWY